MWVFSQEGFVSVVIDKQEPGNVLVRARHKVDLENLLGIGDKAKLDGMDGLVIGETPTHDYPFRLSMPQPTAALLLMTLALQIDYSNFKSRVHQRPDQASKNPAYMDIWSVMRGTEKDRPFPSPARSLFPQHGDLAGAFGVVDGECSDEDDDPDLTALHGWDVDDSLEAFLADGEPEPAVHDNPMVSEAYHSLGVAD